MHQQDQTSTKLYILLTLVFLICYIVLTAMLEHKKYPVHRSTVAILVGIVAGFVLHVSSPASYNTLGKLDQVLISEILLPPMLFNTGYTLHKSVFFKNIKYILVFGLLGTFLSFLVSWGLIYEANNLELVRDAGDIGNFRTLSDWQILLLAACLCSIDPCASEQSVSEYKYPRLYSVIFGEDVLKDTVTIVLFDSVMKLESAQSPDKLVVYWYTFFQVLLNFIVLILGSVAIALVSSFLTVYLSKKLRFLTEDKGVSETGFLFLMGFFTYIGTELLGFSGSISMLLYGVFLNHYNIYNMSDQSRHSSVTTFTLLSNICEGLLFLVMGLLVWQGQWQSPTTKSEKMTHSYIFFFIVLMILCVARFVNVYVLGWLGRKIGKKRFSFGNEEMHILFLGGIVRGAIPFVLFSSVSFGNNNRYVKNQGLVLKTTVIFVIIFTSVVLNTLIPIFYRKRAKKLKAQYQRLALEEEEEQIKNKGEKTRGKLKNFEQKYIKKLLIVDYEERTEEIAEEKRRRKEAIAAAAREEDEEMLTEEDHSERLMN